MISLYDIHTTSGVLKEHYLGVYNVIRMKPAIAEVAGTVMVAVGSCQIKYILTIILNMKVY